MLSANTGRQTGSEPPGFNIVEVLIALSIIGILAGVAIPGILGGIQRTGVDGASRQLADDIRLAQASAITRGVQSRLVAFDQTGVAPFPTGTALSDSAHKNLYRIEIRSGPSAAWPTLADSPGTNGNVLTTWNDLGQFKVGVTNGNTLMFNSQGFLANSASTLDIVMLGSGGTRTVRTSVIGKATIQ